MLTIELHTQMKPSTTNVCILADQYAPGSSKIYRIYGTVVLARVRAIIGHMCKKGSIPLQREILN